MHTPGPWEVREDNAYQIVAKEAREDGTPRTIAYVDDDFGDEPREECEANARLIAAAPCLLEELKWLVLAAVNALNHHDLMRNMPEGAALIQRIGDAKKAIAKAEGKP